MPIVIQPETGIPFPFDTQPEEISEWRDKARAAVETIKEIISLGGSVEITEDDRAAARQVATGNAPLKITEKNSAQLLHLEAILSEYDRDLLNASTRLRTYVTNKLLLETVDEDAKVRLKALELLGKTSGVGLFSDNINVNVTHRTTEQVDSELNQLFDKYLGTAEEVKTQTEDELNSLLEMSDEELGVVDVEPKEDTPDSYDD